MRVACLGSSDAARGALRLLRRSGRPAVAGEIADPPPAEIVLVLPAPGELGQLEQWNAIALNTSRPWLQVLPWDGRMLAVGPLYLPGLTACFTCYRLRRSAALGLAAAGRQLESEPTRARAGIALPALAAALAVEQALGWLSHRNAEAAGILHAIDDPGGLRVTSHRVLPVPLCPACSGAA